jgi:hypothetical protein
MKEYYWRPYKDCTAFLLVITDSLNLRLWADHSRSSEKVFTVRFIYVILTGNIPLFWGFANIGINFFSNLKIARQFGLDTGQPINRGDSPFR